jgi:hypothetical protein
MQNKLHTINKVHTVQIQTCKVAQGHMLCSFHRARTRTLHINSFVSSQTPPKAPLLVTASLILFLRVFNLQGKDASMPAGKLFQSFFFFHLGIILILALGFYSGLSGRVRMVYLLSLCIVSLLSTRFTVSALVRFSNFFLSIWYSTFVFH